MFSRHTFIFLSSFMLFHTPTFSSPHPEKRPGFSNPHLFFGATELAQMKARIKFGFASNVYSLLGQDADKFLALEPNRLALKTPYAGRSLQKYVLTLAMKGLLSDERVYIDKAILILTYAAQNTDPEYFNRLNSVLAVGDAADVYAVGLDWLGGNLSPDENKLLRNTVETFGKWIYEHSLACGSNSPPGEQWGLFLTNHLAHNWNAVAHGPLGLCALVLGDKKEWLSLAQDHLSGYLHYAFDDLGAFHEGVHYMTYGLHYAIPFCAALERAGGPDLLAAYPASGQIPSYVRWHIKPNGREVVPLNACYGIPKPGDGIFYITTKNNDAENLWAWQRLFGDLGDQSFGNTENTSYAVGLPYLIIWEKPLNPRKPGPNPMSRLFPRGEMVARDGWGDFNTLVTFSSGNGLEGVWNQGDRNSFTFYAQGEEFAIDRGYGRNKTCEHNAVLINGIGQSDGKGIPVPGKITWFEDLGSKLIVRGSATDAYGRKQEIVKSERSLIFRRSPQPYLVIYDDIQKDFSSQNYDFFIHTSTNNKILIQNSFGDAIISGGHFGSSCVIKTFAPDGTKLQIKTDPVTKKPDTLVTSVRAVNPHLVTILYSILSNEPPPSIEISDPTRKIISIYSQIGVHDEIEVLNGTLILRELGSNSGGHQARPLTSHLEMSQMKFLRFRPHEEPPEELKNNYQSFKNIAPLAKIKVSSTDPGSNYSSEKINDGHIDSRDCVQGHRYSPL